MKFTKIKELIYDKESDIGLSTGYSLCTVYTRDLEDKSKIKLQNFGYMPSKERFYYSLNVHLKEEVINHINSLKYNKKNLKKLEQFGIYDLDNMEMIRVKYELSKRCDSVMKRKRK